MTVLYGVRISTYLTGKFCYNRIDHIEICGGDIYLHLPEVQPPLSRDNLKAGKTPAGVPATPSARSPECMEAVTSIWTKLD